MPPSSIMRSNASSFVCQACRTQRRYLSQSSTHQALPPESPRFIEVPQPPQQEYTGRPVIKGVLPVPRNVFQRPRSRKDKATEEFVADATPLPKERPLNPRLDPRQQDYIAWKERMAASRRTNLREGLRVLHDRKVRTEKRVSERSAARQAARKEAVEAPQRDDERLTSVSVSEAVRDFMAGKVPQGGYTAEEMAAKEAKIHARQQQKLSDQQDMLHTLYMNARTFITNETQLNDAVDKTFGSAQNPIMVNSSLWKDASPMTTQEMLSGVKRTVGGAEAAMGHMTGDVTQRRVKRIAEEFTGGKI